MTSRPAAVRRAAYQVLEAAIGDHTDVGSPLEPVGSNTVTSPTRARAANVSRAASALTDVTSTGPSHSRIAGTASPVVLPDCAGPTTSTEVRGSPATRTRPWR